MGCSLLYSVAINPGINIKNRRTHQQSIKTVFAASPQFFCIGLGPKSAQRRTPVQGVTGWGSHPARDPVFGSGGPFGHRPIGRHRCDQYVSDRKLPVRIGAGQIRDHCQSHRKRLVGNPLSQSALPNTLRKVLLVQRGHLPQQGLETHPTFF